MIIKLTKDHEYYRASATLYSHELMKPSNIYVTVNDQLYIEQLDGITKIGSFAGNCVYYVQETAEQIMKLIYDQLYENNM